MSHWHDTARRVIHETLASLPPGMTTANRRKAVNEAYPFGERKYFPYKVWLAALKQAFGPARPRKHVFCLCPFCDDRAGGCLHCSHDALPQVEALAGTPDAVALFRTLEEAQYLGSPERGVVLGLLTDWLEENGFSKAATCLRNHKHPTACLWLRRVLAAVKLREYESA